MCRWLAYSGFPIYLDAALFEPENSLIRQSLNARMGATVTNGDGFGVGWYSARPEPGLFRDILPAWNDDNLKSVSEQIRSHLFFAHVRASTGTATSRANCHPFRYGRWLFMHNGHIGNFPAIQREMELRIAPELYSHRIGTTDSEAFFYLMLTNGLDADPEAAFARTVAEVDEIMTDAGIDEPFRLTAAVTGGGRLWAVRYARNSGAPSLYYGEPTLSQDAAPDDGASAGKPILVVSEPLDSDAGEWVEVPEAHMLLAGDGALTVTPFTPV